jgi:uncharacterized protein YbjT (DUF2867 family)
MKTLLLVGATGLVGRSVLAQALADTRVVQVVAPTRHAVPPHPKLLNPLIDFDDLPADVPWWAVDGVICTLGTTIKKAGSPSAFRRVDHDYPLSVATLARRHGAQSFALTSSVGASATSRTLYLRTKGETERDLAGLGFPSLTMVRPSIIGGNRAERRPLEAFALRLVTALAFLTPRRFRIVPAERIAQKLLAAALSASPGTHLVESESI